MSSFDILFCGSLDTSVATTEIEPQDISCASVVNESTQIVHQSINAGFKISISQYRLSQGI